MSALGLVLRWVHLGASIALVGGAAMLLLAGPSDRPTACAWQRTVARVARLLLVIALLSGAGVLAYQTAVLEGRAAAALEPRALARVATQTQSGLVWLVRLGILLVAGFFAMGPVRVVSTVDWLTLHGEMLGLAVVALGLLSAAGHAAAAEPSPLAAIGIDFAHLVASGLWAGALPALAILLRRAARADGADARPYAVLATQRFSRWALVTVLILAASGVATAVTHVRDVAGLVGTTYGRLLVLKLFLFALALGFAAWNRRRWVPAVGKDATTIGRPAMLRLASAVTAEALLVTGVIGIVAALAVTPPARHVQPTWPLSFRFTTATLDSLTPDVRWQLFVGSQVVVIGAVVLLCAVMLRRLRWPLAGGALVLLAMGSTMTLGWLTVDAYPTTYQRPSVPYSVTSIVAGGAIYTERCAACHGRRGGGDGPAAPGLPKPPADLRAPHTGQHTAGDLFWWVSHGIPRGGMPGFATALAEELRWDVINYVRFLGAVEAARWMGPTIEPGRPWLVAPDFTYAVAPAPARTLRDYRGRRHVLLVLYTLPASLPRLAQLAESYQLLATLGVEIIAVPTNASPKAIKELGPAARVLFPVATEGAADIATAYRQFFEAPHIEFLIDRQGYVRARWPTAAPTVDRDVKLLIAEVQELNEEKVETPPADEHVH